MKFSPAIGILLAVSTVTASCGTDIHDPSVPDQHHGSATVTESDEQLVVGTLQPVSPGFQSSRSRAGISSRISERVPSFGGAFVAGDILQVYLTVSGEAAAARPLIQSELQRSSRPELKVQFLQGKYSYRQLDVWLSNATRGGLVDLLFAEIDERNNAIRFGVATQSARNHALATIARLQIPSDAAIVDIVAAPQLLQSLRDEVRPLRGGTQIIPVYTGWNSEGFCTYGVNVTYMGKRHMVTNSHCTQDENVHGLGGYIGAIIHQPNIGPWYARNRNTIGHDVRDPHFTAQWWCDPSIADRGCRWSEAALVEITTSDAWDHGGIARPANRVQLPQVSGALSINSSNPRIALAGTTDNIFQGDVVDKVGRTTGWTAGTVANPCRHIYLTTQVGTFGLLCSGAVDAGVGRGDSGSPVFTARNGEYHLAGIVFAGLVNPVTGLGEQFYYSRWQEVNNELGDGNLIAVPPLGDPGDPWEPPCEDPTQIICDP